MKVGFPLMASFLFSDWTVPQVVGLGGMSAYKAGKEMLGWKPKA